MRSFGHPAFRLQSARLSDLPALDIERAIRGYSRHDGNPDYDA